MKYRPLKKGELTKPTDEKKLSGPNEPEQWETSVLNPVSIRVEIEGIYRRPCNDDTYKLFRACEIIMEAAKKYCLKEFFHGPLGVLFRMQEENCPAYDPKDDKGK
jgi:hypothetical protein